MRIRSCGLIASSCIGWCTLGVVHAAGAQVTNSAVRPAETSGQESAGDLAVAVGKSMLVDFSHSIQRIAVGSSEIAEVTAVSPTEVMLIGKAAGETSLIVWQVGGDRQFFNVNVRASNFAANDRLESVDRELQTELPGQQLRISAENGLIFLRGTVKDLTSSDRAVQIAGTAGKVVNLLYVDIPPEEPQILLKVRFASVDRSSTKQLGMNLFSLGATNSIGSVTTQQFSPPAISTGTPAAGTTAATPATATLSNLLNLFIFRPDINLGATIEALEASGIMQILAEPNVLTTNGKEGSFLAGGQFPYPVVQGSSGAGTGAAVTIQFKEFGVRLSFIPTITPRGTIRLQVAPEVSSLDFANGVTISGFTVPGLDVRKVKTEVELSEGQSFAIGGLLDNRDTKNLSKIPFIGDIPVLGKFFQSVSKVRTNTELIVIVTPVIIPVIPVGAPLPELKYPEEFLPANSGIPMTSPEVAAPGAQPPLAKPGTMPVEQLIQSMQPEKPLAIDSSMAAGGLSAPTQAGPVAASPGGP